MAYTKFFALKSVDYMLDLREDELVWEYHPLESFTIATNTADAEVATDLDEVVGLVSLNDMDTFAAGDSLTSVSTDGVITTGAVTVRVVTVSIVDGAFKTSFFLLGKLKRKDIS